MRSKVRSIILVAACLVFFFFLLLEASHADSRTNYLIDLLKNSGNYRVRVQSAKHWDRSAAAKRERSKIKS